MKDQSTNPSPIAIINQSESDPDLSVLYRSQDASVESAAFEAAFIDSSIHHLRQRLESLPASVLDIVFLSPVEDGLQQIAGHLAENPSLTGVHLLAPCCQGEMMLGDQLHSVEEVQTRIQAWLDQTEVD